MINQQIIEDPFMRRGIGGCFYLVIPLAGHEDEEIAAAVANATRVEKAIDAFLDGRLSIEDLLESVEDTGIDMDQYCDEVESNLTETLSDFQTLQHCR